jgi:hypothetical protein
MRFYLLPQPLKADGNVELQPSAAGVAATEQECASGSYLGANPGVGTPGRWNASLQLCQPTG